MLQITKNVRFFKYYYYNPLKMESKKISKKLSQQISKLHASKEIVKPETSDQQSSYFSPRRTRNQRKVKIEYEEEILKKPSALNAVVPAVDIEKTKKPLKRTSLEVKKEDLSITNDDKEYSPSIKEEKWMPPNWLELFKNLQTMRSDIEAPVDTMGCHKCSDENADEKTKRYHILVALMLSSQTKDQITFEAMSRLKNEDLSPKSIADMDIEKLANLLYPVSFYKNKAKFLQKTSEILIEKYNSDIPKTIAELVKLPGVGPKMAHICMNSAWNIVTGIGVDVHVHRISNRLGWVRKPTKEPEKTRLELESWLPSELWSEVNCLLVGFGQTICTPVNPKCNSCLNRDICPSANLPKSKNK